jgi:hypothetical protein
MRQQSDTRCYHYAAPQRCMWRHTLLWFYLCSEHRGYRGMSRRTQALCRTKLPCSKRWEKEGPVLLCFRLLNLMFGRSHCLFIAVNQLLCHLKGFRYKKFQWQSWSAKPGRAVGVGNSKKPPASSSTPVFLNLHENAAPNFFFHKTRVRSQQIYS